MEQLNIMSSSWKFIPIWAWVIIIIWVTFWKGIALWTAVKEEKRKWFVAILLLNTFGILELIYVFYVAKKKWSDVKAIFSGTSPSPTGQQ